MPRKINPIDVVYILGDESRWDDREIFYSVRSVEKHLKNYRKIFIVGRKPIFFGPNVIEIPYQDIFGNKARNIMAKIRRAATDTRVTGEFILMNDDYFLLEDVDATTYPYYYKNTLQKSVDINCNNGDYLPHLQATLKLMQAHNLPTKNFDSHYLIRYNKAKFRAVCDKYDWAVSHGFIMRSVYCNTLGIEGIWREDCKINHPHIYWDKATAGLPMFSIGHRSGCKALLNFLYSNFPKPSNAEAGGIKIW